MKTLCVFCGSSLGFKAKHRILAENLGKQLARRSVKLVYGGGKIGLMGVLANSVLENGGTVTGVIPEFLKKGENINLNISKTIIVKTMAQRKKILFEKGDAFLILPGGSGTIEEATEVISWKILGIHNKPIIIFNFENYWNSMIEMYSNSKKNKFGNKNLHSVCKIVETFEEFSLLFK